MSAPAGWKELHGLIDGTAGTQIRADGPGA
jgi:hypothetical protein